MALKDVRFLNTNIGGAHNPTSMLLGAGKSLDRGFNSIDKLGQQIAQRQVQDNVATAIGDLESTGNMLVDRNNATKALLGVGGVGIEEAVKFSDKLFGAGIDERKYADDRIDANNLNSYRDNTTGSYSFKTDDFGNNTVFNNRTGDYESVGNNSGLNTGSVNPKNIVLKSMTNRDSNGVETTTQVPFNKLTGEPIEQTNNTGIDMNGVKDYLQNTYGITSQEQIDALPTEQRQAIEADIISAFTPAVDDTNVGVGVKYPKKLDNTIQLPTGEIVYVDAQGNPYQNKDGQHLVKTQGTDNIKKEQAKSSQSNTIGQLDNMLIRIQSNPDSVGSIGSDFGNWVGNNLNDILKVPTADRLNRNQIESTGGVVAAGLRKGLESGVMTEPDFQRYMKLVPNINDSPQEAMYKATQLKANLAKQYGLPDLGAPEGYKAQYNPGTGEYRYVPKQ